MKTDALSNSPSKSHGSASSPVKESPRWIVGVLLARMSVPGPSFS